MTLLVVSTLPQTMMDLELLYTWDLVHLLIYLLWEISSLCVCYLQYTLPQTTQNDESLPLA